MKDLLVIMGATSEQGTMGQYLGQLADAGIETHVETIADFHTADMVGAYVEGLRRLADKFSDYGKIVLSDAFDVTFHGTKDEVLSKIPDQGVLLAAERNCYPDLTLAAHMPGDTPWRFINGGLTAGTPKGFRDWADAIESSPDYHPKLCGQGLFNLLRYKGTLPAPIDERTELFYCLYLEQEELGFDHGLPVNTMYKTRPNFIHANGHWPTDAIWERRRISLNGNGNGHKPSRSLRKMSIEDLKMDGTPNYFPTVASAAPPMPKLTSEAPSIWMQVGAAEQQKHKVGTAVMLPTISRNGDGSLRYTPPEWGMRLALLSPILDFPHAVFNVKDVDRGPARTALVKQAMEYGCRWGYMQDDDVVPPPDVLQKLQYVLENADDNVVVAGGIYTTKTDPAVPLVFQDLGVGPYWRWKKGQVFECQAIATGCMMIDLHKIKDLPEPWFVDVHGVKQAKELGLYFDYAPGAIPLSVEWTDDMYFCWKLRKHGLRMMAHGGVICDHWGQDGKVYRLADDSYPMRP
jgi:hypothetical protein